MSGVIIELQRDALDSGKALSDILRKALVVARKLRLGDLRLWLDHELDGYPGDARLPEYRVVVGSVRAHNPYHGMIPVMFSDLEYQHVLERTEVRQSVSTIEYQLVRVRKGGALHAELPPSIQKQIWESMDVQLPVSVVIDASRLHGILDAVRNAVVNWTLTLEEGGIRGEGLQFSPEERATASSAVYNIEHFIGTVSGSQVQQGTTGSRQAMHITGSQIAELKQLVADLRSAVGKAQLAPDDRLQAEADLTTAEAQLGTPAPKRGIVKEALASLQRIAEGVAMRVVAAGLADRLGSAVNTLS